MKHITVKSLLAGAWLTACFCTPVQAADWLESPKPQAGWFSFQAALKDSDWLGERREQTNTARAADLVAMEIDKVNPLALGSTLAAASTAVSLALPWAPALAKVQDVACTLEEVKAPARLPLQTAMN